MALRLGARMRLRPASSGRCMKTLAQDSNARASSMIVAAEVPSAKRHANSSSRLCQGICGRPRLRRVPNGVIQRGRGASFIVTRWHGERVGAQPIAHARTSSAVVINKRLSCRRTRSVTSGGTAAGVPLACLIQGFGVDDVKDE